MYTTLLLLCLLAGAVSVAQATVSGRITDSTDKKPLEKVTVKIGSAEKTVATNDEGFFEIKNLKTGNYLLQFTCVGYKFRELPIAGFLGKASLQKEAHEKRLGNAFVQANASPESLLVTN